MRLKTIVLLFVMFAAMSVAGPRWAGAGSSPASFVVSDEAMQAQTAETKKPDVHYVPTPPEVVEEMLKMADVHKGDVLYDLGSGDGRIVIAAAKKFGVRGVGIDIDPERIREAEANAKAAGVTNLVKFRQEDLFEADIHEATVVTLYLLERLNEQLRPKLLRDLKPGTRIVSHAFRMGDWEPEKSAEVNGRRIYMWTVPAKRAAGK